jgi:hypothetical protein
VSDDQDVDLKIDTPLGKGTAKLSSRAAGTALIVAAYGTAIGSILCGIAVVLALLLGYEEISFGILTFKSGHQREQIVRRKDQGRKSSEPQMAWPSQEPSQDDRQIGEKKIAGPLPPVENKSGQAIGPPLDLRPHELRLGEIKKEVPESQGDDRDSSEPIPPNAYPKYDQLFIQIPEECKGYSNQDMYEACFYSSKGPNGRPVIKD